MLDDAQRAIVDAADWVCVMVGPSAETRAVLDGMRPPQRLAWVVKADADAFPPDLRAGLAARADLTVHNRAERPFVAAALQAAARPARTVVETRGADGAALTAHGRTSLIAAEPVAAPDPAGAGDTFAGGLLAALIAGPADPVGAVRAGQHAAWEMLQARARTIGGRRTG